MKIYKSESACLLAAQEVCLENNLPFDEIQSGSYKGGKYDCYFIHVSNECIIDPEDNNGRTIFSGAY
jgi:hypothetical protein